ncbi:MAG TPA: hypothetical protein VK989_04345 [Polyangia bacterium]|nr:hypothetical protein [Polyangia bacterium]
MARLERHGFALIACLLAGGGLVGCSSQVGSGPDVAAAPRAIELDAMGASYESGLPAQLDVALGPTPMTTVGFMVSHGADWISMIGQIDAADLGLESLNLSVTSGALAPGFANVQVGRTAGAPDLTGAIVQLHFSPRGISGELVPANSDAPWSFDGDLSVSCSVPVAEIPDALRAGGGGTTNAPGALVADGAFSTPECAPLRRIAGQ